MNPIKIQILLDGAAKVAAELGRVLSATRSASGGMSQAGKALADGMATAQSAIDDLTKRIDRSNAAFERLRASGKLTAEQLARLDAARQARVEPLQAQRAELQTKQADMQVASARDTLGVRPAAETAAQIAQIRQAYATLAASGKLSSAELAQAAQQARTRIAELQAQVGNVSSFAAMRESVAGLLGSLAVFGLGAREAIQFEAAMADVKKVANATPAEFQALTRSIRDMSAELPVTAVGLAQMAEAGGALGVASDKLPEFVRLASEMSVAFKIMPEEAGNAVGKLSNIFGLSLGQMRTLADSVNALGDSSAATERDIVNVLQRTGGMAKQFGLTAQQTSALAASLLSLGDPPEIAATAVNNLLSKLQAAPAQSKDFQSALKVLGVDAKQLAKDIEKDAQGALIKFLGTLEGLDSKSRSNALSMMFGTGGDTASIAKLVGSIDTLKKSISTAESEAAKGGLGKALAIQTETADSALKRLRNNVGDIGIAAGAALLPAIKALADLAGWLARVVSSAVDAAPHLVTFGAVAVALSVSMGALRAMLGAGAAMMSTLGLSAGAATGTVAAAGVAATGASVGVGALGAAVRFLLGPVGLAIAAIEGLIWVWGRLKEAKDKEAAKTPDDLRKEREQIQAEIDGIDQRAKTQGVVTPDSQSRRNGLQRRAAVIDDRLQADQRQREEDLRASAGARGGTGDGYEPKKDITQELQAMTEAAQAAMKARLKADQEAHAAKAALDADAHARELAELQRRLDAESISLDVFYRRKRAMAEADVDAQISVKQQERAALAASKPASDADKETQRGEMAKLDSEIQILRRSRAAVAADITREQNAAQIKIVEAAEQQRLAVMQRGLDQELALAREARAAGEISARALAAAEVDAAERRVQAEIDAKERILAARREAKAPAADIRAAEGDVAAARVTQRQQRADRLTGVAERIKTVQEQSTEISLSIDADPAKREIHAASEAVRKLREQAESDAAVLTVQLHAETDPAEQQRIKAMLADLARTTDDAIAARNEQLADQMKPGWQKMLEGWKDTTRLMRDGHAQMMEGIVKGGEDAFVQFVRTGKLSVRGLVDDLIAQMARVQFRKLISGDAGQSVMSWVSGMLPGASAAAQSGLTLKGYSGDQSSPNFMGPLPDGSAGAGASGAASGLGDAGQAAKQTAGALGALSAVVGQQSDVGTALVAAQQGLQLAQMAGAVTQQSTSTVAGSALGQLALAATYAAAALESMAATQGASMMAGLAADGAVIPFARGGQFTNSIVTSPTLFAFARGKRLGLMGEAGPEAIVPLDRQGGASAVDENGKPLKQTVQLTRGRGGRLSVVISSAVAAVAAAAGSGARRGGVAGVAAGRGAAPARFAVGGLFGVASSLSAPSASRIAAFAAGGVFSGGAGMPGAARIMPAGAGGAPGLQLTQSISMTAGVDANAVAVAMQRAKAEAVAAVAEQMQRGNRRFQS